jgi:DNA-binding NarL/FixJ family response regulator
VVVEDQLMFLQLLVAMLAAQPGIEVVATADSVALGRLACLNHRPDVLILDLALPDGRGTLVLEALRAVSPCSRVIILSGEASSFVCPREWRSMVHAVVDKTRAYEVLSQELASLLQRPDSEWTQPLPATPLTPRENEILSLIGRGLSNREIAAQLHLSQRTVETHRKNIAAKVGASGPELIRLAALRLGGLPLT